MKKIHLGSDVGPRAKRLKIEQSRALIQDGKHEQILTFEAQDLLIKHLREVEETQAENGDNKDHVSTASRPEPHTELELEIEELSSTGDGLAYSPNKDFIYVVPFSIPGDRVLAKTFPQRENSLYSKVDLVKVLRASPKREGVTPQCKYFSICSGCQLQMMPYEEQLNHKKTIVEKAFRNFSHLDPSLVPPVGDTIGSPLQYGYRTKLTPHFDGPSKRRPFQKGDPPPHIGFGRKNNDRHVLDIEQCPIGTPILNEGMKVERQIVHDTFHLRKNGATILLRESTKRESISSPDAKHNAETPNGETKTEAAAKEKRITSDDASHPVPLSTELRYPSPNNPELVYTYPTHRDIKTYTSDNKGYATEYIGPHVFTTNANSFFQNNNSILPRFLAYIQENLLPKTSPTSQSALSTTATPAAAAPNSSSDTSEVKIKYLLDAYCGSGLFSVGLASGFRSALGIDIDVHGVEAARGNAKANGIPNAGFIAADAECLFADVPFPPEQTLVVIDPPRKGASASFLQQLCEFGPRRVVYVSCNVHTQARDVGMLVAGFGGAWRFDIESLRGFDFFPQTGHVEGVCFLNRVKNEKKA